MLLLKTINYEDLLLVTLNQTNFMSDTSVDKLSE